MGQLRTRCDASDIVSKKNATGSTIVKGAVVKLDTTSEQIVLPGASTDGCFGVAREDIPTGTWGNIQTGGLAICLAASGITVGQQLMPDTNGKVATWSAAGGTNAALIGVAQTAASASDYLEVELAAPFTIKQG
jgi:predicted RecA/RadA family phage recombinase